MSKAIYSISALSFKSLVLNREKLSKKEAEKLIKDLKKSEATHIEVEKEAGGRLKYIQFSRLTPNGKWCKLIM